MSLQAAVKLKRFLLRLLLVIALLSIHYLAFLIPLSEIFLIYVLFFNPQWFKNLLDS